MARAVTPATERFWTKVDKSGDCWLWRTGKTTKGYGQFHIGNTKIYAHRYSYVEAHGPIPDGLVVDHKCHVRHCVRPEHLRLATLKQNQENRERGIGKSGVRGVYQDSRTGKWIARVFSAGTKHHVGVFDSIQQAEVAAIAKRNELFTHNDKDRQ